jgi:hypothetical protein
MNVTGAASQNSKSPTHQTTQGAPSSLAQLAQQQRANNPNLSNNNSMGDF